MQAVSSSILFDYVPRFSREIHAAEGLEDMKASAMTFIRELHKLLFKGEKVVLNGNQEEAKGEDEENLDFLTQVKEEAERFNDAVEQVIEHFQHEIDQARSYSNMLKEQKSQLMSPRISILAKQHQDSLTPQIVQLRDDIQNVNKIRDEVLERVRDIFDNGASDAMSYRYTGKKSSQETIEEEPPEVLVEKPFKPKLLQTRFTGHYLPAKVKAQNFESPEINDLRYDKYIIGIGDYGNLQFYFIFNDLSQTKIDLKGPSSKNKETVVAPAGSIVRKIRL